MPEIGQIRLREGTIGQSLANLKPVLLPEEVASDDLAQWVMRYDTLAVRDNDSVSHTGDVSDPALWEAQRRTVGFVAARLLQTRMPFYFAALFHIGRQLKVSRSALDDCSALQQPDRISASSHNLAEYSRRRRRGVRLDERTAEALLRQGCEEAIRRHESSLGLARGWWQQWRSEVSEIRQEIDRLNDYSRDAYGPWIGPLAHLCFLCAKPSVLERTLEQHSVRFKRDVQYADLSQTALVPLLGVVAILAGPDFRGRFELHHAIHYMEQWVYEQAKLPECEYARQALRKKYGDSNPFDTYRAGVRPADQSLRQLIYEFTLPNGSESRELYLWRQGLENSPYWGDALPKAIRDESLQQQLLRSADSTIKRHITDTRGSTENWGRFLQRVFEEQWIHIIGFQMGRANRSTHDYVQKWTTQELAHLVSDAVCGLNHMGYDLSVPPTSKLTLLLEKASGDGGYFGADVWRQ